MSFTEWKVKVDAYLTKKYGLVSDDLPDIDYRGLYESGDSPSEAAKEAIRNAREC